MGRPRGSRNRSTRALHSVLSRLEYGGEINLEQVVLGLYRLAVSETEPSSVRIAASRELLNRAYGLPKAHLDVEHGVSESTVSLLVRIAQAPEYRRAAEELEQWRRSRAIPVAVTVEPEEESQ